MLNTLARSSSFQLRNSFLKPNVNVVQEYESVYSALRVMKTSKSDAIAVVNKANKFQGILTLKELLLNYDNIDDLKSVRVDSYLRTHGDNHVKVAGNASVAELLKMMSNHHTLAVIDKQGGFQGLVTPSDLVKSLASSEIEELTSPIHDG